MKFKIGPFVYTLRIVRNLVDENNKPLRGRSLQDTHEILIDAKVHHSVRKSVLMHELSHCWEFYVPAPQTNEDRACLNEMVYNAFHADFTEQNGDEILEKMKPDDDDCNYDDCDTIIPDYSPSELRSEPVRSVSNSTHTGLASHEMTSCPICDARRGGGSVVNSPPKEVEGLAGLAIERTGYCDGCHILYRWQQLCNRAGKPLENSVATEPQIIRGPEVNRWLEAHPQLVGSFDY